MKYFAITLLIGGFVLVGNLDFSFMDPRTGVEVYTTFCVSCHGEDGRGHVEGAADFVGDRRRMRKTDEELLESIREGKGEMPRWSGILTEEEMVNVLQYIRETFTRRQNR